MSIYKYIVEAYTAEVNAEAREQLEWSIRLDRMLELVWHKSIAALKVLGKVYMKGVVRT